MNAWCQPVEHGFANPLGGRPQAFDIHDIQKAATPVSGYNTQPSAFGFTALFFSGHRRLTLSKES
jgi:hypothetical protein